MEASIEEPICPVSCDTSAGRVGMLACRCFGVCYAKTQGPPRGRPPLFTYLKSGTYSVVVERLPMSQLISTCTLVKVIVMLSLFFVTKRWISVPSWFEISSYFGVEYRCTRLLKAIDHASHHFFAQSMLVDDIQRNLSILTKLSPA